MKKLLAILIAGIAIAGCNKSGTKTPD